MKNTKQKLLHLEFKAREFLRKESKAQSSKSKKLVSQSRLANNILIAIAKNEALRNQVIKLGFDSAN